MGEDATADYHLSWKPIKRSDGRSAVAAAAYRSGERLRDERTGLLYDYTHRRREALISSWIQTPDGAPFWTRDRGELWNRAEAIEKRINSRPAREAEVGLPVELTREQQDELLRGWVREQFTERGMVADVCIHRGHTHNPHAHIMLTTRELEGEEFARSKATENARSWDGPRRVEEIRESWEVHSNRQLREAGRSERISCKSLRERGVLREPTIHEGPNVRSMEERGIYTERGAINRGVMHRNEQRSQLLEASREMEEPHMDNQKETRQEDESRQEEESSQRDEAQREEEAQQGEERQIEERRQARLVREAEERDHEQDREM